MNTKTDAIRSRADAMHNRAMASKILKGEAIDISDRPREGRYVVLDRFFGDTDYCDASTEQWIWSVGRRHSDGKVLASFSGDLYQNPDFECLWLR